MKTYLIRDYELSKFKAEYSTLAPNNKGTEFFIKAWVSAIGADRKTLKVIVSDEKPSILFSTMAQIPKDPRSKDNDELETTSRKDTLWGDLKLMTKKAIREGKHHLDHYQKVREQSIVAPINLTIVLRDSALAESLNLGEGYYFRLVAAAQAGLRDAGVIGLTVDFVLSSRSVVIGGVSADAVSAEPPATVDGKFTEFLAARTRRKMRLGAVFACVAILGFIYLAKEASVSERNRVESEAHTKLQKEKVDRRAEELAKKTETAMERLKVILEKRRDIGLLIDSDVVKWEGRGGPITIHEDGTWTEEKSYLALWPQDNWQRAPYESRLSGLETICGIWRGIWGSNQNGEAEVRLFRNLNDQEQAQVGGCKQDSDIWLSKDIAQNEQAQASPSATRKPARRRRAN